MKYINAGKYLASTESIMSADDERMKALVQIFRSNGFNQNYSDNPMGSRARYPYPFRKGSAHSTLRDWTVQMIHFFRTALLSILALCPTVNASGQASAIPWDNLPMAIRQAFGASPLTAYDPSARINPFYLRADLDGDGKPDYVVLVTRKADQKRGIAIWLSSHSSPILLGGGIPIKYGSKEETDLDFDSWRIASLNRIDKSTSIELPRGKANECIFVQKGENASGLILFFEWKV